MKRFSNWTKVLAIALTTVLFTQCTEDDLSAPIITLDGLAEEFVKLGDTFTEPGATATDVEDGDITTINIDDTALDTETVGSYDIFYSATDAAGNVGSSARTVHVFAGNDDYAGTYAVEELCDTATYNYNVTITASADPNKLIIDNFGDFGITVDEGITIAGNTNSDITVNATEGGATFTGSGLLIDGSTTGMVFTLDYTTVDSYGQTLVCAATFTKQ